MPAMTETYLPRCCTPLNADWPFAQTLPGVQLISTSFDPALLDQNDFTRAGVMPILSLIHI